VTIKQQVTLKMIQKLYTLPHVLMVMNVQKELPVMMMEKTKKKAVTTMMLKVMKTKLMKKAMRKKKKREDFGLRKSLNISEVMMLMPHKLKVQKMLMLKKTLKQKVTTVKMMVKTMEKEMTKKAKKKKKKRKREDYGLKRLPNTSEVMML